MKPEKIYSNQSYWLLVQSIESERTSKLNKTICHITSHIADTMIDTYSIDEQKIAAYEYLIEKYSFSTKKEKIHALKLIAEHGITIAWLKAIWQTTYWSDYKTLVQTCNKAPWILQIEPDVLLLLLNICTKESRDIKSIQRDKIYHTNVEPTITKDKIELLYNIYGSIWLIHGINTWSLYYIQFMTNSEIQNIINFNPDINLPQLNREAKVINDMKMQKLYEKNPPTSAWW